MSSTQKFQIDSINPKLNQHVIDVATMKTISTTRVFNIKQVFFL